ncbi:MAG: hypothetical protein KDB24_09730, partial [Microthrixaceae bacterium]|nr:hypothetical protein [Microthrixaceae bacterium]
MKDAVPDTATDFHFEHDIDPSGRLVLDDDDDPTLPNSWTFTDLRPGGYTVTEMVDPDYVSTVACVGDAAGATETTTEAGAALLGLDAGENLVCTFTNTLRPATVVVQKEDTSDSGTEFDVSVDQAGSSSALGSISDDGTTLGRFTTTIDSTVDLTVSELVSSGFAGSLSSPTGCTINDADVTSSRSLAGGEVVLGVSADRVGPGDTVVCTFRNDVQGGQILIRKTTPDGPTADEFEFGSPTLNPASFVLDTDPGTSFPRDSQQFSAAPGTHVVTETPHADYTTEVECSEDGTENTTTSSGSATINIESGEIVVCTFTNT